MKTAEARELQELELQSPDDERVEKERHQVAQTESSEPRVRLSRTGNEGGKRTRLNALAGNRSKSVRKNGTKSPTCDLLEERG